MARRNRPMTLAEALANMPDEEQLTVAVEVPAEVQGGIAVPGLEDEDSWEGELPPATESDLATALAHSVTVTPATEDDLDQLWDWVRTDEDRGEKFFGFRPQTSRDIREWFTDLGTGLLTVSDDTGMGPIHVGFLTLVLGPLGPDVAAVGLYLSPEVRGQITRIAPQLFGLARKHFPDIRQFVVQTDDAVTARLYKSLGFELHHMLVWTPVVIEE